MAEGDKTYSAKQVATRIGTDAKQLRKFFRDPKSGYDAVGQGGRYDFPETDIGKIKEAFVAWNATKTRRNRTPSPQAKLASASGLIPGQRKDSPSIPVVRRSKDNKEGLHGNALDDDDLKDRMKGIAARVRDHGLTMKQGRFVPLPKKPEGLTIMSNAEVVEHDDWQEAQSQVLDFSKVDDDLQDVPDSEPALHGRSSTELDELGRLGWADDEGSRDPTEDELAALDGEEYEEE